MECMCGGSRPIGGGPAGSGGPLWNPPFGLPPRLLGRRPPFIMLPCDPRGGSGLGDARDPRPLPPFTPPPRPPPFPLPPLVLAAAARSCATSSSSPAPSLPPTLVMAPVASVGASDAAGSATVGFERTGLATVVVVVAVLEGLLDGAFEVRLVDSAFVVVRWDSSTSMSSRSSTSSSASMSPMASSSVGGASAFAAASSARVFFLRTRRLPLEEGSTLLRSTSVASVAASVANSSSSSSPSSSSSSFVFVVVVVFFVAARIFGDALEMAGVVPRLVLLSRAVLAALVRELREEEREMLAEGLFVQLIVAVAVSRAHQSFRDRLLREHALREGELAPGEKGGDDAEDLRVRVPR